MLPKLPSQTVDRNSEFRGVSTRKLMKNAGKQAAKIILQKYKKIKTIQIFCGSGGNGGDGFVVARELLKKKITVEIILANKPKNADAKFYLAQLPQSAIQKYSSKIKINGDVLIDALLGVGSTGKLRPPISKIVARMKKSRAKIVSLDIPTGNLKPKLMIAFHHSKGVKNEVIVPIGVPAAAEKFFGPGDAAFHFPQRGKNSHKGENGRVVIVGGSRDFVGAPLFAGFGALAAGVDLVDIFVPKINFLAARKFSTNFLVHEFTGAEEFLTPTAAREILAFARKNKATLVIGPGLGKRPETVQAVQFFAQNCRQPLVLDADALIKNLPKFVSKKVVLTPHAGEFRRLPKKLNAVILRKGATDEISFGRQKRWNDRGHPILTVGGTGDTLAGLVGGLMSRKVEPFEAAGLASFLLGLAGEKIALKSESATPQALAKEIPKIIRAILDRKI